MRRDRAALAAAARHGGPTELQQLLAAQHAASARCRAERRRPPSIDFTGACRSSSKTQDDAARATLTGTFERNFFHTLD